MWKWPLLFVSYLSELVFGVNRPSLNTIITCWQLTYDETCDCLKRWLRQADLNIQWPYIYNVKFSVRVLRHTSSEWDACVWSCDQFLTSEHVLLWERCLNGCRCSLLWWNLLPWDGDDGGECGTTSGRRITVWVILVPRTPLYPCKHTLVSLSVNWKNNKDFMSSPRRRWTTNKQPNTIWHVKITMSLKLVLSRYS